MNLDHDKWLEKFNKTKEGKIFNIVHDFEVAESDFKHPNKISFLCAALYISSAGTKHKTDAVKLIRLIHPEFFNED